MVNNLIASIQNFFSMYISLNINYHENKVILLQKLICSLLWHLVILYVISFYVNKYTYTHIIINDDMAYHNLFI